LFPFSSERKGNFIGLSDSHAPKITKIKPGILLQYILTNEPGSDNASSSFTVSDELTFENGESTLSVTDDVGKEEGAEERYNKSENGWDKVLKGLKELVEGEK
jgi:hypothetical protein